MLESYLSYATTSTHHKHLKLTILSYRRDVVMIMLNVYTTGGLSIFNALYESQMQYHMGRKARKPVFGGLGTTQAQTSLRIRSV